MEANLSPSFSTDSPLDLAIKTNLITDVFNCIGIKKMDRRRENVNKMKQRFKNFSKTKQNPVRGASSSKNQNISRVESSKKSDAQDYLDNNRTFCEKLSQVSSKNRTMVRDTLVEDSRKGNFIRIYPNKNSDFYDQYFITPRVSNKVLYKFLFTDELIVWEVPRNFVFSSYNQNSYTLTNKQSEGVMMKNKKTNRSNTTSDATFDYSNMVAKNSGCHYESTSTTVAPKLPDVKNKKAPVHPPLAKKLSAAYCAIPSQSQVADNDTQNTEKLMITGDDVLIEYVARLMIAIKSIKEKLLRQSWKNCIDKFIRHYVWHTSDTRRRENNKLWQRLESRLIEMKERRKRLLRSLYKKELTSGLSRKSKEEIKSAFELNYETKENQKNVIIQALSALELEDMLRKSTKNVAHEVVS